MLEAIPMEAPGSYICISSKQDYIVVHYRYRRYSRRHNGKISYSANALRDWLEPGLDRRYQLEEQILVQEEPLPEVLATHLAACKSQNPDDRADCQAEIKPGTPTWCQYAKPLPLQGRAFRHANLQKAILCGVDLSVDLNDADLSMASLQRRRPEHGQSSRRKPTQ